MCSREVVSHQLKFCILEMVYKKRNIALVVALFCICIVDSKFSQEIMLEHSFNERDFVQRGNLIIEDKGHDEKLSGSFPSPHRFGIEHVANFQKLIDNRGFYQIRVRTSPNDASPYVMASIPACYLRAAKFRETLIIELDSTTIANGTGEEEDIYQITSLSYGTSRDLIATGCEKPATDDKKTPNYSVPSKGARFKTVVIINQPEIQPPLPVNVEYGSGPGVGKKIAKKKKNGKEKEENATFFQKYWIYIIPAVLILTMGGGDPNQTQGPRENSS